MFFKKQYCFFKIIGVHARAVRARPHAARRAARVCSSACAATKDEHCRQVRPAGSAAAANASLERSCMRLGHHGDKGTCCPVPGGEPAAPGVLDALACDEPAAVLVAMRTPSHDAADYHGDDHAAATAVAHGVDCIDSMQAPT
eukprot:SAG31_NODE_373_length_16597_cov_21.519518_12_plen_143_part_00